jgi:dihydrofolate reductase
MATTLYVTWVEGEIEGDTFFPAVDWGQWRETASEQLGMDEKNEFPTRFCVYERI